MAKTTKWFPGTVKPVHVGLYQRRLVFGGMWSWWNGKVWCGWGGTEEIAARNGKEGYMSSVQDARWRGLRRAEKCSAPTDSRSERKER